MTRVKRLILLAGPRCVGKTWLIKSILEQNISRSLTDQLDLSDPSSWKIINANQLPTLSEPFIEKMLVHYNMLRQWELNITDFENSEIRNILDSSEQIVFLTLWTVPEFLVERIKKRKIRALGYLFTGTQVMARIQNLKMLGRIHSLYLSHQNLFGIYNKWFDFCATYPNREDWIMSVLENDWKLFSVSEWERLKLKN